VKTLVVRALFAALGAMALSGCIDSASPILADAEPVFGKHLRLSVFSLHQGYAREPGQVTFNWNGTRYARASGALRDVATFSAHPFEGGDYIIQSVPVERGSAIEYALLHELANGVYLVLPIDEADADDRTRAGFCKRTEDSSCRIETREQLFAFAGATAALRKKDGGLVIRLDDRHQRRR
jgi:hypothetical protein